MKRSYFLVYLGVGISFPAFLWWFYDSLQSPLDSFYFLHCLVIPNSGFFSGCTGFNYTPFVMYIGLALWFWGLVLPKLARDKVLEIA